MNPAAQNPDAAASRGTKAALASLGAIGSILVASSCCLPILPFVFAAGFAGASTLLTVLRPYLLVLSVLFVAYGFYQGWRAKQCNRPPSIPSLILLWSSAAIVFVSILLPQVLANLAAGLLSR